MLIKSRLNKSQKAFEKGSSSMIMGIMGHPENTGHTFTKGQHGTEEGALTSKSETNSESEIIVLSFLAV